MPSRVISTCFKPRNLRLIILTLVIGSLIIALYHIYYGNLGIWNPTPTDYFDTNRVKEEPFNSNNEIEVVRPKSEDDFETDNFDRPSFKDKNQNTADAIVNYYGNCSRNEQFKADINSIDVYQNLPFDADWIRGREYWNSFFEQRYTKLQKSEETPYMKIFVIPHSHNDPGWLRTFEQYFYAQTKNVIDNSVDKLLEYKNMTFQWSEISFLSKWWDHAHPTKRANLKKLVQEGRFEIVTGGWVMTDEATVHLYSMIDQLIEGQQWVKANLDIVPKTSWSVDPFGHGSTFPYILERSGFDGMVIQRIHYAWKKWFAENQDGDFRWVQRWDTLKENSIICHNAPFDIYSIKHSCGPHPNVCLNFDFRNISGEYSENAMVMTPITQRNLKEKAELLLEQYGRTASLFPHNIAMISLGDDFRFDRPIEWDQQYTNYMKLFEYINANKDHYRAEVKFATISQYFKAIHERHDKFKSFSGDFFAYSDIFSEGRPAYWTGYFGTRPFWKKFYRETESSVRSAEILFTYVNSLAKQRGFQTTSKVLMHEYNNLSIARRWLGLFAHHDATTGTSKVNTMNDYGLKLLDAYSFSQNIQMYAISTMLFGQVSASNLSTDYDLSTFGEIPRKIPLRLTRDGKEIVKKITLFNSLGWTRGHFVKVAVTSQYVQVLGPDGQEVRSQLNPVVEFNDSSSILSPNLFELTFMAHLNPLSVSVYTVKKADANDKNIAEKASVYCKSCKQSDSTFTINKLQAGDIQFNNAHVQLLFDRSTGLLLSMKKIKENLSTVTKVSFGGYQSVEFRSGAYLLMPNSRSEQKIPFEDSEPNIFIISGPVSSEFSVFALPLFISFRLMNLGGKEMEEAVYIQNEVNLGQHNSEVYMRFETDLDTRTSIQTGGSTETKSDIPTFYTDQSGYTMEKRVKVSSINLEGNYYPVTSSAYIQDEKQKCRFTVLVDRAHGFASFENGRIETLIERRTRYDDARGMGEGVTDNRATISNYILLLESIDSMTEGDYSPSLPTISSHHISQSLNYPPSLFTYDESPRASEGSDEKPLVTSILSHELPCDSHLLNLRTVSDTRSFDIDMNFPSEKALLIIQKLSYICPKNSKGCNSSPQNLFEKNSKFVDLTISSMMETFLTGIVQRKNSNGMNVSFSALEEIKAKPFEIKSVILAFN